MCPIATGLNVVLPFHPSGSRVFSTTPLVQLKEFFPRTETRKIVNTETSWRHPVYTSLFTQRFSEKQMRDIQVAHREARDWSDWVALGTVRFLRRSTDFATKYRHPPEKNVQNRADDFVMTERKWLVRFIFLESVAGVPGMVGGMLRHLRSLRRMKRDNRWIETLLEEAFNERMHLLTFLQLAEPGWFMRLMVLGAQGVFFNAFFISYLLSPRTCHRFVGYLEEEAVLTYSRAIEDLEAGKLPKWQDHDAPNVAIQYWNMPEGHRKMKDLLLYIRADEAKHREVNHTLGNLNQKMDPNPYAAIYKDPVDVHPTKGIDNLKPHGWERKDAI
ncbi:putative alternative oxidase AlxA [Talaromyces proteolyticus]|uniref:Alternative oxidase n=1 Tax=Talaromyces proteolyticus TaxID=1131652 RepID=A0AAD4PW40_9EURO|nr:putative alternative oxidase AlxA [Talaromyces proteolyticus]KAH8697425.1 putative alternative oxidase AlxA [Talaromyces proteolyticus]